MTTEVGIGQQVRQWFVSECIRLLTKPLKSYELRVPNNTLKLKKTLRKGDVILVEGDQRVSQVIRYLTQSSWSHAALYVGDELLKPKYGHVDALTKQFGSEARYLMIEAVVGEGVIASPLRKYERFNIRICRPQTMSPQDLNIVMTEIISHLGDGYDVRHVFDLARFFFPVSIVPRRWRRAALHFGSGREREVICSSMIARAFSGVGYPVLPQLINEEPAPPREWWQRLLSRNGHRTMARFRCSDPALITPRDFDLSSYFEVVKFNHVGDPHFTYRDIVWESDTADRTAAQTHERRG